MHVSHSGDNEPLLHIACRSRYFWASGGQALTTVGSVLSGELYRCQSLKGAAVTLEICYYTNGEALKGVARKCCQLQPQ